MLSANGVKVLFNVPFQRVVLLSQSYIEIFALQLAVLDQEVGVRCRSKSGANAARGGIALEYMSIIDEACFP